MKREMILSLLLIGTVTLTNCQKNPSSETSSASMISSEIYIDPFSENATLRTITQSIPVGLLSQNQVEQLLDHLHRNDAYPNRLTYSLKETNDPEDGSPDAAYFLNERTTTFTRYDEPILYIQTSGTSTNYGENPSEENSEISLDTNTNEINEQELIYAIDDNGIKSIVQLIDKRSPISEKIAKVTAFSASKFLEKMTLGTGATFVTEYRNYLRYQNGQYWFTDKQVSLTHHEKYDSGDVILTSGLFVRQWAERVDEQLKEYPGVLMFTSITIRDGMVEQVDIVNSFMKAPWGESGLDHSEQSVDDIPVFLGEYHLEDMIYGYAESYQYQRNDFGHFGIENLWNTAEFTEVS